MSNFVKIVIGDPVSQLHKVAFEYAGSAPDIGEMKSQFTSAGWFQGAGSYLSLLNNDVVGLHRQLHGQRLPLTPTNSYPTTPTASHTPVNGHTLVNGTQTHNMSGRRRSTQPQLHGLPDAWTVSEIANSQSVRRVNSHDNLVEQDFINSTLASRSGTITPVHHHTHHSSFMLNTEHQANAWSEEVSDMSVWTIVGTESIRYSFYHSSIAQQDWSRLGINSAAMNGLLMSNCETPAASNYGLKVPVPVVYNVKRNQTALNGSEHGPSVWRLEGDGFTTDMTVWFGSRCALRTELKSSQIMVCWAPEHDGSLVEGLHDHFNTSGVAFGQPMVDLYLVRHDGMVYKTGHAVRV